jgi:glycosyltransferase involved in cell wall biosynthesis
MPTSLAVVITALNEGPYLRRTVENCQATLPPGSEIVVVDDGSDDGSADFLNAQSDVRLLRTEFAGVARARNLGARSTSADIVLFADAHLALPEGWWAPIVDALEDGAVGGVAPAIADMEHADSKGFGLRLRGPDMGITWLERQGTATYAVPMIPWCCSAMRRDTFLETGGFDEGMLRWGSIDNEMSVRLRMFGYQLMVASEVVVSHLFRDNRPYDMQWRWIAHNKLRLAMLHFSLERIELVVKALAAHQGVAAGIALLAESDIASRRRELAARRRYDDGWFFLKSGSSW